MNPRQQVLMQCDVYRLLGEILAGESGVVIDGGANIGEATKALRRRFPNAELHAFEPVVATFDGLRDACQQTDAVAHRLALGDRATTLEMHVNKNDWTCSLLPANERGMDFHDDWCETVRTEEVGVVRLDDWALKHGVDEIALLKLDLQGYELPALRGAGDLLGRTKAVFSEAQVSPEYTGASTFGEIDGFLRSQGFGLYQIVDLCLKGTHLEPSCCDGLWLRSDVLERVLSGPAPSTIGASGCLRHLLMSRALDLCARNGHGRVAIYGGGAHTVACGAALATPPVEIVCLIDDTRAGGRLWGTPVVAREEALGQGLDAVVLSSEAAEEQLIERCGPFFRAGVAVVRLYGEGGVSVVRPGTVGSRKAAV